MESFIQSVLWVMAAFWGEIAPKLATLAGLIVLDVILGAALAIRRGEFKWDAFIQFYWTMIVPYLLSWFGFVLVLQFINTELIPPDYQGWLIGLGNMGWVFLIVTMLESLVRNGKNLYGEAFAPGNKA